jgi:hypothetical protein
VTVDGGGGRPRVVITDGAAAVAGGGNAVVLRADGGRFGEQPDWWYAHRYPVEADRGLDDYEDLFTPGRFTIYGSGSLQLTLWAAAGANDLAEMSGSTGLPDWDAERRRVAQARGDGALPNQPGTSRPSAGWSGRPTTSSSPAPPRTGRPAPA